MTLDDLKRFAPGGKGAILHGLADDWGDLARFQIDTRARICHFMAQIAHEADGFATMEEYASGAAYENRSDLGNTQPGDGKRFKGRGLIQCTGRANYRAFTAFARKTWGAEAPDFEKDPAQLATMPWALRSALWYWDSRKLNRWADKNEIRQITKRINGGYNGLADRRAWFRRAVAIWGEGQVSEIGGRGAATSRTGIATLIGGGAGVAGIGSQAYEIASAVEGGKSIADNLGIPLFTLALLVLVVGLLVYIFRDRLFLARHEGL